MFINAALRKYLDEVSIIWQLWPKIEFLHRAMSVATRHLGNFIMAWYFLFLLAAAQASEPHDRQNHKYQGL